MKGTRIMRHELCVKQRHFNTFCRFCVFLFCFTWSSTEAAQVAIQETPVRIVTSSDPAIFPKSWLRNNCNAQARALPASEIERSRRILNQAAAKYPGHVLDTHLGTVYILRRLAYFGRTASGTNSRRDVYIANGGIREGFSDDWCELTFHHEFSSILLRNLSHCLDKKAWEDVNGPSFRYGVSGVQAMKDGKSRLVFDGALHEEGFLYEYAKSTLENDFNSIAAELFIGHAKFWEIVDRYPKIRSKTDLAIGFYNRVDAGFNRPFFLGFAEKTACEKTHVAQPRSPRSSHLGRYRTRAELEHDPSFSAR